MLPVSFAERVGWRYLLVVGCEEQAHVYEKPSDARSANYIERKGEGTG